MDRWTDLGAVVAGKQPGIFTPYQWMKTRKANRSQPKPRKGKKKPPKAKVIKSHQERKANKSQKPPKESSGWKQDRLTSGSCASDFTFLQRWTSSKQPEATKATKATNAKSHKRHESQESQEPQKPRKPPKPKATAKSHEKQKKSFKKQKT